MACHSAPAPSLPGIARSPPPAPPPAPLHGVASPASVSPALNKHRSQTYHPRLFPELFLKTAKLPNFDISP